MGRICCSWPWALMMLATYALHGVLAAADSGDDFSNNLFTDLAPLLSLFGEQFAKQFMSVSMGWLDHIVFAMAPLGIITALAAAIRVGGPAWLKAVIGRARENRAIVELELMSSTSHEVCELWNGQGIVRTMGTPEIQEIIYLEDHYNESDTFGLYTLESAKAHGLLRERELGDPLTTMFWGSQANDDEEQSDTTHEKRGHLPPPKAAPNISLNLHGGSSVSELLWTALCGTILQSGVLIFAGFSVYHPGFRRNFSKAKDTIGSESSDSLEYAYPIMAGGTILLTLGLVICLAIVDNSTEEKEFIAMRQKLSNDASISHDDKKLRARILWLQRSHVVSDQAFNATVIFKAPESGNKTLDCILTSQRAETSAKWQTTEFLTILGVFLGLCGFILQFQGLRGLHWSISIAQLGCIMMMTALRAWLRRHLILAPISKQVPTQHELDWLALWLAKHFEEDGRRNPWPTSERILEKDAENMRRRLLSMINVEHGQQQDQAVREIPSAERFIWRIKTSPNFRTCSNSSSGNVEGGSVDPLTTESHIQTNGDENNTTMPNGASPAGPQQRVAGGLQESASRATGNCSSAVYNRAQRTLKIRQRLAQLTRWTGEAGLVAVSVAQSIGSTLDMLFTNVSDGTESFSWSLEVQLDDSIELVEFCAFKRSGQDWTIDATQIEAVLALWLFHLNEVRVLSRNLRAGKEEEKKGSGEINDWLQKDVGSSRCVIRMLGPDSPCLKTDICWWVGSNTTGASSKTIESWPWKVNNVAQSDFQGPIGFGKCHGDVDADKILTVEATGPLVNLLGQHIFTVFMWAVATDQRLNIDQVGATSVASHDFRVENPSTILSVRLENRILSNLARKIEGTGLCNFQEAYFCIIPPLSAAKSLPALELVGFIREKTRHFEYVGKWNIVIPVYIRLFQELNAGKKTSQEFFQASIILIETLISITGIIKLQIEQHDRSNIDALEQLTSDIQKELKKLPIDMRESFARIYKVQGRFDGDLWQQLGIDEKSLPRRSRVPEMCDSPENVESLYNMFEREPVYSRMVSTTELLTIENIEPHEDPTANTTAVDIFGWTPLHYAVLLPDSSSCIAIQEFIDRGVSVNAIDLMGRTPLCIAIAHSAKQSGNVGEKKVKALIGAGANLNTTARDGRSPLHYAAEGGSSTLTALLLNKEAKIELQDHLGQSPIHLAAFGGHYHVLKLLLDKGAYIGATDHYGRTPLHLAALAGRDEVLKKILAYRDVEREPKDRWGRTPLDLAGLSGNIQSFTTLFRYMMEIEEDGDDEVITESDAFLYAVRYGMIKIVQKWLKSTSKETTLLEYSDSEGFKALHLAARYDHIRLLYELLNTGFAVDTEDLEGMTALHVAARHGQVGCLRLLINHGASLERQTSNSERFTALHLAAMNGECEALIELLKAGVNIDIKTGVQGLTSLHIAARHGNLSALHLLIVRGASMETTTMHSGPKLNRRGFNALHIAAKYGHCDIIVELLTAGIPIDTKTDHQGLTALHIAARHNREEAVDLLVGRCASLNETTNGYYHENEGYNALHIATIHGNYTIVHKLLGFGSTVNNFVIDAKTSNKGYTALHIAVIENQLDILKLLIHHGANLEATTDSGFKPLYLAAMTGERSLVKCLLRAHADPESRISNPNNIKISYCTSTINICPDAISVAASYGHNDIVRLLKSAGAEINNQTPIKMQITSMNINGEGKVGLYSGALMAAVCGGHLDTVQLLQKGAEFPKENFSTVKVCQVTLNDNAKVIIGFGEVQIEDFSAKGHARLNIYRSMLSAAIAEGHEGLPYSLMWKFGAPLNGSTNDIMGFLGRVQISREFSMSDAARVNIDYANLQFQNARATITGRSILNAYRGPLLAAVFKRDWYSVDFLSRYSVNFLSRVNPNWSPPGFVNFGTGTAATETEYFHLKDSAKVNLDCSTFSLQQTSVFQNSAALNIYSGPLSAAALYGHDNIVRHLLINGAKNARPHYNVIQPYIENIGNLHVLNDAMEAAKEGGRSSIIKILEEHNMEKVSEVVRSVPNPAAKTRRGQIAEPVTPGQEQKNKEMDRIQENQSLNPRAWGINAQIESRSEVENEVREEKEKKEKQHRSSSPQTVDDLEKSNKQKGKEKGEGKGKAKNGVWDFRSHSVRFEDEGPEGGRRDQELEISEPSTAHTEEGDSSDDEETEKSSRQHRVSVESEDDEEDIFLRTSRGASEGGQNEDYEESSDRPRGPIMLPWYD